MLKIKIYVVLNNFWEFFFHKQFFCQCETKEKKSFFFGKIKKIAKSCSKSRTNRSEQLREKKFFFRPQSQHFRTFLEIFFFILGQKKIPPNLSTIVFSAFWATLEQNIFLGKKIFVLPLVHPWQNYFFDFFPKAAPNDDKTILVKFGEK